MAKPFMRISVGAPGGSAAQVHYITREPATNGERDAVLVRNYPSEVTDGRNYDELRDRLEEYAEQKEVEELERPRHGGGETRTHYKVILSFEREIDTEQAPDMGDEYLDREFRDARAIAAVHQDTDKTHVHIHIQARDVDGEKLHFDRDTYEHLDEAWADIYDREFGREFQERESVMERELDIEDERAIDDGRDEAGDRDDEREAADGESALARSERALDDSAGAVDRADEAAGDTLHAVEDVADRLDGRSPERVLADGEFDRDAYDRDDDDRGR